MNCLKHLFVIIILCASFQTFAQHSLTIDIPNIKGTQGILNIALYNKAASFPKIGQEFKILKYNVALGKSSFQITDLPESAYAVAIYHDQNSDGKMNTNMLGIPKEGYGFSKNFSPKFSAPNFSDCAVKIQKDQKLVIALIY